MARTHGKMNQEKKTETQQTKDNNKKHGNQERKRKRTKRTHKYAGTHKSMLAHTVAPTPPGTLA